MLITVKGKQVDVGDSLREHIREALSGAVGKYFPNTMDGQVVLSREAHLYRADMSVHVGRGILLQSHASAGDPYAAADSAIEHVAKRLRRHKRRLRDHDHHSVRDDAVSVPSYVLRPIEHDDAEHEAADSETAGRDEAANGGQPVIIAEMTTTIATLSVSDAVMRLDLSDQPMMLFRHPAHGGLNVVYRRPDGNIGWVDPDGAAATVAGR